MEHGLWWYAKHETQNTMKTHRNIEYGYNLHYAGQKCSMFIHLKYSPFSKLTRNYLLPFHCLPPRKKREILELTLGCLFIFVFSVNFLDFHFQNLSFSDEDKVDKSILSASAAPYRLSATTSYNSKPIENLLGFFYHFVMRMNQWEWCKILTIN